LLRNCSKVFLQVRKWIGQHFSERFYWHDWMEILWADINPEQHTLLKKISLLQYSWWKQDWTMFCCPHCSQLSIINIEQYCYTRFMLNILFNIVDKCEQRGQQNIVNSYIKQQAHNFYAWNVDPRYRVTEPYTMFAPRFNIQAHVNIQCSCLLNLKYPFR
jgi:hypothetical protein